MRIVYMGTPDFSVIVLEYLLLNHHDVVAVYTQPDREVGRGRALAPSPVKQKALEYGLPVVQPESMRKAETMAELASYRPDVIVVAAFGQILPQGVLDTPQYGCLNVHPSLLPHFRGPSPVASAILSGCDFTGVSIMLLDKGMDTGPVFMRGQIPILARDTTGSLTTRLFVDGAIMLLDVIPRWVRGKMKPRPQDDAKATYSRTVEKEDGEIDWGLPAVEIWRRVRAFQPWPGSYTWWGEKQVRLIEAMPVPVLEKGEAGEVIAIEGKAPPFGVVTGDGVLGILKLQLAGKRSLSAAEFIRGQRDFIGARLTKRAAG